MTFELGTDINMAQVLVQNRVAIAEPSLPEQVKNIGVTTKKRAADILLAVSLYSEDNPATGRPAKTTCRKIGRKERASDRAVGISAFLEAFPDQRTPLLDAGLEFGPWR